MFTRQCEFTHIQRERFIATWGAWDADHRMRIIGYQYLAAKEVFERYCTDRANRVFRFKESVGTEIIYYPHPDEPWLIFTLRDGSVWAYENVKSLDPYIDVHRFEDPGRWQRACDIDQLPVRLWVPLGVTEGMDYPVKICRVGSDVIYGQWI